MIWKVDRISLRLIYKFPKLSGRNQFTSPLVSLLTGSYEIRNRVVWLVSILTRRRWNFALWENHRIRAALQNNTVIVELILEQIVQEWEREKKMMKRERERWKNRVFPLLGYIALENIFFSPFLKSVTIVIGSTDIPLVTKLAQ